MTAPTGGPSSYDVPDEYLQRSQRWEPEEEDEPPVPPLPIGSPVPHKKRIPLSTVAIVVLGVVAIIISDQVVWLVSVSLRPNEVSSVIPTNSEAVKISAISGMLGLAVGFAGGRQR